MTAQKREGHNFPTLNFCHCFVEMGLPVSDLPSNNLTHIQVLGLVLSAPKLRVAIR